MNKWINEALSGLTPHLTEQISAITQAALDSTQAMTQAGSGLINKDGSISGNPQAFGFAFEHLQVLGFNIKAALQNSSTKARQIPANGEYHAPDISIENVTNPENAGIPKTQVIIDVDGIQSFPVNLNLALWVAENPILAANLIQAAAFTGEVAVSGISGATVNATINVLTQSIKVVGAYCRGEQALATAEVEKFLKVALEGLQQGFIRGAAIKCIERLSGSSVIGVLGFSIGIEVVPVMIQLIEEEISLDQAIAAIGPRLLTSGFVSTVVMLFPPVGLSLLSASVLHSLWEELTPEWQTFIVLSAKQALHATEKGLEAGQNHLLANPWDVIGASSASSAASSSEMQALQNELDDLLQ